jgi:hypothetical protein
MFFEVRSLESLLLSPEVKGAFDERPHASRDSLQSRSKTPGRALVIRIASPLRPMP